jgi:DNA polymerase-3 subunit delta'
VPNSVLFSGPLGVGKIDFAQVLAQALNCLELKDDACGHCTSCLAIAKGNHPDVMYLAPEKEVIKIEQMRILKETAYLKPMSARKRVFILGQAEKMNTEAANSLLKILEEPPGFSHILLLTDNPFVILPTIKSRCQILNFSPISREDIEHCLLEQGVEESRAKILSLLVSGNLKQALALDWEDVQSQREKAWQVFLALAEESEAADLFKQYSAMAKKQLTEELRPTLEIMASFCRDALLLREEGPPECLMNPDYEDKLQEVSEQRRSERILNLLSNIEGALFALQRNLNTKLFISRLFLKPMESDHV